MDAAKFGSFIARSRKDKNMTQAELAIKINVTDKAVSRWERGLGFISDNDNQVEIKLKEDIIACFDEIKDAKVHIHTLSNEETYINILLELQSDLSPERIDYLVAAVSGAMGSNNADNIEIIDIDGTILYSCEQRVKVMRTPS